MKKSIFTFYALFLFVFSVEANGELSKREYRKMLINKAHLQELNKMVKSDGVVTRKEKRALRWMRNKIRKQTRRDLRDRNRF